MVGDNGRTTDPELQSLLAAKAWTEIPATLSRASR